MDIIILNTNNIETSTVARCSLNDRSKEYPTQLQTRDHFIFILEYK